MPSQRARLHRCRNDVPILCMVRHGRHEVLVSGDVGLRKRPLHDRALPARGVLGHLPGDHQVSRHLVQDLAGPPRLVEARGGGAQHGVAKGERKEDVRVEHEDERRGHHRAAEVRAT